MSSQSSVLTALQSPVSVQPLILHLRIPTVCDKIEIFFQNMFKSGLFDQSSKDEMLAWKREFLTNSAKEMTAEQRLQASFKICDFLSEFLFLDSALFVPFKQELKSILEMTLPPGEKVDEFIKKYNDMQTNVAIMTITRTIFQQKEAAISAFIKRAELEFNKNRNTNKDLLLRTISDYKIELEKKFDELRQVAIASAAIDRNGQALALRVTQQAKDILRLHQSDNKILDECKDIAK